MTQTKKGTLVLIEDRRHPKLGEISRLGLHIFFANEKVVERGQRDYTVLTPIIVCDDEIKYKDKFYSNFKPNIFENYCGILDEKDKKVLVDTPQIPQNVLDAIVSGELKDGDEVEVQLDIKYFDARYVSSDKKVLPIINAIITWNKEPIITEENKHNFTHDVIADIRNKLSAPLTVIQLIGEDVDEELLLKSKTVALESIDYIVNLLNKLSK
jgi:hypothetical protein